MSATETPGFSSLAETALIPLCVRAAESQRPDPILCDDRAVDLVRRLNVDAARILSDVDELGFMGTLVRSRTMDRLVRSYLSRRPDAVVVHIGCGFDTRLERVDNGSVEWYDLDLAEVIELRRNLLGEGGERHHLLAGSVLEDAWYDAVRVPSERGCLVLAEGVLMYFSEAQVRALVPTLRARFPGAQLAFDAFSPFFSWANNLRVDRAHVGARSQWALKRGSDLEQWAAGIRMLDEAFILSSAEPRLLAGTRLARAPWLLHLPLFGKAWGVFHYQL